MAKKQQAIEEIANWEDIASELPDIPPLVEEFKELKEMIALGEERCKEIAPQLEAAVITGGKKSLACGNYKVTQVSHPGQVRILPERIVEKAAAAGMTADAIVDMMQFATEKKPYTYPLVTRIPTGVTEDE